MMRLNRGRLGWWHHRGRVCGCLWRGSWGSCTACLWIGFAGWPFGGLTLLGPPAISFMFLSVYIVVDAKLHAGICYHQHVVVANNAFCVYNHA